MTHRREAGAGHDFRVAIVRGLRRCWRVVSTLRHRRQIRLTSGALGKIDESLGHISGPIGDRRSHFEGLGRPGIPALPTHQLGLADGYLAPGVCAFNLVFKNQRFEVQVFVLDLPPNGCNASSPLIRLKQE